MIYKNQLFEKRKVYASSFIDNIWEADLEDK